MQNLQTGNTNMSDDLTLKQLYTADIPEAIKQLGMNYENLKQVADYCEANYNEEEDKKAAFNSTITYATHSLACVANQIGMAAEKFLQFLELENGSIHEAESTINELSTLVSFHEQKVSRRSIAHILRKKEIMPLPPNTKGGIVLPTRSQKKIEYIRNPVDYTILDNVGHGVKNENLPSPTISQHAYQYGTIRSINNKSRHSGSQPSGYATISHANNFSHYRVTGQVLLNQSRNRLSQSNWRQSAAPTENPPPPPSLAGLWAQQTPVTQFPDDDDTLPPPPTFIDADYDTNYDQYPQHLSGIIPSISDLPEVNTNYDDSQGLYQTTGMYMMQSQEPEQFTEKVIAIYDYKANEPDELTFQEHSVIYVLQKNQNGWWEGIVNGERGLFPSNYVEPCI